MPRRDVIAPMLRNLLRSIGGDKDLQIQNMNNVEQIDISDHIVDINKMVMPRLKSGVLSDGC